MGQEIEMQVDIAMPCFNAEPWLDRCMDSVLAQERQDWKIVARDDNSTDGTARCLAVWKERLGDQMRLVQDSAGVNLGVVGNYNCVLERTSSRWVATLDPDDIWLPGRLNCTLKALKEAEDRFGEATPIAICTDAAVIDDNDSMVASSYWRWARNDPSRVNTIAQVAMESPALGSTMAVNRALLDAALPIHAAAPYQDWWLALVAVAFGRLLTLRQRAILYRRHSSNSAEGPLSARWGSALRRTLESPMTPRRRLHKVLFKQAVPQAAAFLDVYHGRLASDQANILRAIARLAGEGPVLRRVTIWRNRLWFASPVKNLGLLALC